jgi:NitT/TauT family transport system permease protein
MPADVLDRELAGLDHLEVPVVAETSRAARAWAATWPKVVAIGVVLAVWQFLIWIEWKPRFAFAAPSEVFPRLWEDLATSEFWDAVTRTMQRATLGFLIAVLVGGAIGLAMSQVPVLRSALGSLITGLQTMPSIAWFPFAILVFGLTETAIMFVVVLGAAPSIANGILAGVDTVPPSYHRLATNLGAGVVARYRDIVVPAAMPTVLAGLKQGWAFLWRSLMAGELLVLIPGTTSIGSRLYYSREFSDSDGLIASMVVILVIGLVVDALFGVAERSVLLRRGLTGQPGR